MSGSFRPVVLPDIGPDLARQAQVDAQRQRDKIAGAQFQQQAAFDQGLSALAPALATGQGPEYSSALAQLAGLGPQGARLALPMLQAERQRSEAASFWQPQGGQATAPQAGGDYTARMVAMESGGDPNARNPRSTATGAGQFIDGTWMEFARANPELFQGMNPQQILAARSNPDLSRRAIEWYRQSNSQNLAAQGLPANDGTAALAHRFGPQGAASLLRTDPNAPIAGVVGPQVMAANPDLAGRTVGQVVGQYAQRFGGGAQPTAAPQQTGINPAELALIERGMTHDNPEVQRQARARLEVLRFRQQQAQQAQRSEGAGPFAGTSMDAQANNIALTLADRVRSGTATPQEQALYQRAYAHLAGGTIQYVIDPSDPTGQRQVAVRVPREMGDLPQPGRAGGAPVGAPTVPVQDGGLTTPAQQSPGSDATPMPTAPGAIPGMERMTPPPAGFRRREDGSLEPIPGGPQDPAQTSGGDRTRLRQMETDAQGVLDALEGFRQARRSANIFDRGFTALGVPTSLSAAWTNAALMAKGESLYNLGVLNGPDLQIIQRALSDPATVRGLFTGDAVAETQITAIENLLRQRLATARRQFGGQPAQATGGGGILADPPPAATAQPRGEPVRVNTPEEAQRLAPGTPYITPQGQRYTR